MSVIAKLNLLSRLSIHPSRTLINAQCIAPFSTIPSKGSSQAIGKKRFRLSVEKDINKLMNHCCGTNYHKEGEDVKLKDDSEYPDWLWEMPLEPPRLHEYDPATKEYWEKAEIVGRQRENKLEGITNKRTMIVNKQMIKEMELKYRRRFRGLAKYHFNAGHEIVEHHEREDVWNMHEKERYRLPEIEGKPFYPKIDQVPEMAGTRNHLKTLKKIGRYGL